MPVARAGQQVKPELGRWQGARLGVQVVATVEETAHGVRYLVRPVVYCGLAQATYFETSLFNFNSPDAWPIEASGRISTGPLTGRFKTGLAVLKVAVSGTCLSHGTEVVLRPAAAAETLFDGSWSLTLEPHPEGGSG